MNRALQAHPKEAAAGNWPDSEFAKKYPTLVEYLSDSTWSDGGARELSSLSLKFQDGLVLANVNDQDGKRSLYRAAQTVQEALRAIEKALGDPAADWRGWNANTKKKRG